ncbi:cupin domain-containing protein [Candidatus Nitrosotalea okcheonensis]|uniref:Uncharacterized protein n=1 Tax=Candidatus Nitrosotalea okcheonensis TaxID=1903276 RepID=A0A2H1FHQ4_9ARCH|nr:hypothetical protein [Candidatus Nitrosotalea okcheonensis]SMH72293.1 conserved protein of unknown function [Candidatus Nitrosotalea okcheonensis]
MENSRSSFEVINEGRIQLAIVIYHSANEKGGRFYTSDLDQFQLGFHIREKGYKSKPHYYEREPVTIQDPIQEILHIVNGKILMVLYGIDKKTIISKKQLKSGDTIILTGHGAHATEFLEDSKILEIKQGPFTGNERVDVV